ncbi:TetR/AcrR family transcriptional regulator [Nonomuraea africana]|uniref:TetR/AcrR family transcriptional regulator n=1 Tax=Nonomuraea africana TaxID=46171 RepID=UPI0033E463FB
MTSAGHDQRQAILQAATRLFASLGYDGTAPSQIADAAGVDIAMVNAQFGSKREVYLAVMERAYEGGRDMIETIVTEFSPWTPADVPRIIHVLADRHLDFCIANPEVPALWIHRSLSDAQDITELESRYARPMLVQVRDIVRPAVEAGYIDPDGDIESTLIATIWCAQGFCGGGLLDEEGTRHGPDDPAALRRFRRHMHLLLDRMMAPSG